MLATALLLSGAGPSPSPSPAPGDEVRLAFLGDSGTGDPEQRAVRDQLLARPPRLLFLLGDNVYDTGSASRFAEVVDLMYEGVRHRGTSLHAALGNHDVNPCAVRARPGLPPDARAYEHEGTGCDVELQLADPDFGYRGRRRYYSVASEPGPHPLVEVFVLDTNTLAVQWTRLAPAGDDEAQLSWLDEALAMSRARWKVVAMHHAAHSPSASRLTLGLRGHGPDVRLTAQLAPVLRRHRVDAVFAGHNHFYARMVPQDGIRYFVSGGGGAPVYGFSWSPGYVARGGGFHHFVYVRVTADTFEYYAIDDRGRSRDAGRFGKGDAADEVLPPGTLPPP